MRAGQLRKRFEIQTNTPSRDAAGGEAESWATTVSRWGEFSPVSGAEAVEAGQIQAVAKTTVRLRYYSALSVEQRLKLGTRYFSINAIRNTDERNIEQLVDCTEVPAESA